MCDALPRRLSHQQGQPVCVPVLVHPLLSRALVSYILSDTEQLHKKIEELTLRVRDLEKALDEETSTQGRTHPLLDDAYRAIAAPPTQADHAAEADEGAISTQGTIVVNDDGTSKWLGPTAVAAWFLEDELEGATEQPQALKDKSLPADVSQITSFGRSWILNAN
jgi:hypothetical protein